MDFSIERNRREVTTHSAGPAHRSPFRARIQEGCGAHHMPAEAEYSGTVGAGLDPELQSMRNFAVGGAHQFSSRGHLGSQGAHFGNAYHWAGRVAGTPEAPPAPETPTPGEASAPGPSAEPGASQPQPVEPQPQGGPIQVPQASQPLQGGMQTLTISGDNIPAEIAPYARIENGQLVIDAGGAEIPPLQIDRSNVTIKNVRIQTNGQPNIAINGASNITISDSEITGGTRGIRADNASNITVTNNWLHDMSYTQQFDTTAIEFDHVSGGLIQDNRVTSDENHPFRSDAVSMYNSQDLKFLNNQLQVVSRTLVFADDGRGQQQQQHRSRQQRHLLQRPQPRPSRTAGRNQSFRPRQHHQRRHLQERLAALRLQRSLAERLPQRRTGLVMDCDNSSQLALIAELGLLTTDTVREDHLLERACNLLEAIEQTDPKGASAWLARLGQFLLEGFSG